MAQTFSSSRFFAYHYHGGSIATANQRARAAGVEDRVEFGVAPAGSYPGMILNRPPATASRTT
jgi:hypothetical protein